ncbi:MAG TPA: hypothetical protein VF801_13390 [Rhodocyclaceae bacterium]
MSKPANVARDEAHRPGVASVARPVYYVSSRPEAYEIAGEVGHAEAMTIARTIAAHAGRRFPGVEFRVDDQWHTHQPGMEKVAAYIEDHWQEWSGQAA